MGTIDHEKCKQAVNEIREIIPKRLNELDRQFQEARSTGESCDYFDEYTKAMTNLVFDAIEHAVSYADNSEDLEKFSDRLQQADHALDIAIGVMKRSEDKHLDWHREFDRVMRHYH